MKLLAHARRSLVTNSRNSSTKACADEVVSQAHDLLDTLIDEHDHVDPAAVAGGLDLRRRWPQRFWRKWIG